MPLRIVFMGTPELAVPTLTEIVGQGHEVVAVYTQPPRAAGRGMVARKSPVHEAAERFGLPVSTPQRLKEAGETERFADLAPDVVVVAAFGQILPPSFLAVPPHGCLNLHASLLPRWRGAAPVARAIMAGDTETGVMVMRMEEGLDTGPVAMSERIAIGPDMTAGELSEHLARLGADLMVRALAALSRGVLDFREQSEEVVTYASKVDKSETRLVWSQNSTELHNRIRGLSPDPGAWFLADLGRGDERVKVLRSSLTDGEGTPGTRLGDDLVIACGSGAVRLLELQRAGRQPVKAAEFLRGLRVPLSSVG